MSVVFVFDKPEHLPPHRALVHENRAKGRLSNQPVPHSKEYASLLTVNEFQIIQCISIKLVEKCTQASQTTTVSSVIDSPSLPGIIYITQGSMNIMEPNVHGDGDVGVWHQLQTKQVYIKCLSSSPLVYVNLSKLYEAIIAHPKMGTFGIHAQHWLHCILLLGVNM